MGNSCDWRSLAEHAKGADDKLLEKLRLCFVDEYFGDRIREAWEWIEQLRAVEKLAVKAVDAEGVLWTKELRSFLEDPRKHLAKKLYIYALDLQRGKMSIEEFEKTGLAAARTSLSTNMRSIYQAWVFLALVAMLGSEYGARIVFPEHRHILVERSGRQRGGSIPPNLVLLLEGRGYLSFFLEAPRPIGWGDNGDLSRAWRLYVALRPDAMVYSGRVLNMVDLTRNPPILQPDVIIECKELPDWYVRVREVRGPFARPMSGVEWRNRWLRGLWAGLADVLGVETPEEAYSVVSKRRGLRLSEPQIVKLYERIYKPRRLYLIARTKIPERIRRELEDDKIIVVDDVGFSPSRLRDVAEELARLAEYRGAGETIEVDGETAKLLYAIASSIGEKSLSRVVKLLARLGAARLEELRRLAREG